MSTRPSLGSHRTWVHTTGALLSSPVSAETRDVGSSPRGLCHWRFSDQDVVSQPLPAAHHLSETNGPDLSKVWTWLNNDALATMNIPQTTGGGYTGTLCTVFVTFLPTRNYSLIKTLLIKKKKRMNKTKIKDHPNLSGAERTRTDDSQSWAPTRSLP